MKRSHPHALCKTTAERCVHGNMNLFSQLRRYARLIKPGFPLSTIASLGTVASESRTRPVSLQDSRVNMGGQHTKEVLLLPQVIGTSRVSPSPKPSFPAFLHSRSVLRPRPPRLEEAQQGYASCILRCMQGRRGPSGFSCGDRWATSAASRPGAPQKKAKTRFALTLVVRHPSSPLGSLRSAAAGAQD